MPDPKRRRRRRSRHSPSVRLTLPRSLPGSRRPEPYSPAHATANGLSALRRFARLSHTPVRTLVLRIQRSVIRSPFAPAVVLSHPPNALANFLEEHADSFAGFQVDALPSRDYPQGANFGSEF